MYNFRKATSLITQELSQFPLATLSDIYKLFFQNCRGSGHFCEDLTKIKKMINREIKIIDLNQFNFPEYDISYLFKIKRVSLISIMIGKYDANFVSDKFLELTLSPKIMNNEEWFQEWKEIKKLTFEIHPLIIDDLVSETLDLNSSLHHSSVYRENYHPHYRICSL